MSAEHQFDIIVTADSNATLNENARAAHHVTTKLYKTNIADYGGEVDYNDYFYFDGTIKIGDNIVYKWKKIDEDGYEPGYWILTDTLDFSSVSLSNPYTPIGCIEADSSRDTYRCDIDKVVAYSEDDNYFKDCKLEAWELKYCLDNDTDRFAWADADNGKGVIYYMKDEFENECPYDFKNIQFKRWKITATTTTATDLVGTYSAYDTSISRFTVDSNDSVWCYTFDALNTDDDTRIDAYKAIGLAPDDGCCSLYGNIIKPYCFEYDRGANSQCYRLNNIVFLNQYSPNDSEHFECYSNSFGNNCINNTFGNSCESNSFGNSCWLNTFGNYCYSNTFGNYYESNSFGNDCNSNTFGNHCYYNSFGNSCWLNTFGNDCGSNTFGNDYGSNTFGNRCLSNSFGNYCYYNSFGNSCWFNTFGNYYESNHFGDICKYIKFGNADNTKSHYRYIRIESGNQHIYLNCTGTTSSSQPYQNVIIGKGVNNTTTYKTITDANVNQAYETRYVADNSKTIII